MAYLFHASSILIHATPVYSGLEGLLAGEHFGTLYARSWPAAAAQSLRLPALIVRSELSTAAPQSNRDLRVIR